MYKGLLRMYVAAIVLFVASLYLDSYFIYRELILVLAMVCFYQMGKGLAEATNEDEQGDK